MTLDFCLNAKRRARVVAGALVLVALIGWLDHITGWQFSLFVFYAIPILLVVWHTGTICGLAVSILCAGVWYWANADSQPWPTDLGYLWATATRLIYFSFVAIGGRALKAQQAASQARIEALERERELKEEIVRVSEYERQRFGQDLHDGLCQELAAISLATISLAEELQAEGSPQAGAAQEVQRLLKTSVIHARNLARGIFPVQMDETGLAVALEELVATTNRLFPSRVSFESHGDTVIRDPGVAMHFYRIAQEALGNAMKHGGADVIRIVLTASDDGLTLTVTDDGKGWEPDEATPGMGLRTMTYRAQAIGATLEISRGPEGGTVVSCTRPISAEPNQTHEFALTH
jgi:signal transduction histidine kinase